VFAAIVAAGSAIGQVVAQAPDDSLVREFQTPPASAKPRVWWHWMNGNASKAGITADLEWMHRVGIAGFQMFDANIGTPQFVEHRLAWMTPEWKDAFHHAGTEASRLGLEMAAAASGGWSETGGPWVTPQQAMKKVVWSETIVDGGHQFTGKLPLPPTQQLYHGLKPTKDSTVFVDTKVLAFRVSSAEVRMASLHPVVTSSHGPVDAKPLMDGDTVTALNIDFSKDTSEAWLQFAFAKPFRAQALAIADTAPSGIPPSTLRASVDGKTWVVVATLPGPGYPDVRTYSFPPVVARYYRIVLDRPGSMSIREFELFATPRVKNWYDKAQYYGWTIPEYQLLVTQPVAAAEVIVPQKVVDISGMMKSNGTLSWPVPPGRWMILRMGYTPTGTTDLPASLESTGLEVDKLNATHVEAYVRHYLDLLSGALGPSFGSSFRYLLMDSWEAGTENWTEQFIDEFHRRRGYDPTPYLPVFTGRVVESADASDRFLWDVRRVIADLVAENHYEVTTKLLEQRGLGLYAEAMGIKFPTTADGLQDKGKVSIPMGEFWFQRAKVPGSWRDEAGDLREAASAAHIYNKPIAAAESFTTQQSHPEWGQGPFDLKPNADWALASGINRFVIHTSVHQPFTDEAHQPGITLGGYGQHYTRNNTWAEQSVAFNTYLARSSYLLQQGTFVADALYYYGEGAPVAVLTRRLQPTLPPGYGYDWTDTDVLLHRLTVQDGDLVIPGGMRYHVLVLPPDVTQLTIPVLQKIRELVSAGATIIAPRPTQSPSLTDYPFADDSVHSIANEVWGAIDGAMVVSHRYGKGVVYWGAPFQYVLDALKVQADLLYSHPTVDDSVLWIHRHAGNTDIYFVANQRNHPMDGTMQFRVDGKVPELWDPSTGEIDSVSYSMAQGHTSVPIHLDRFGSTFVLFRRPTTETSHTVPAWSDTPLSTISGPWAVSFQSHRGAPASVQFDSLVSWTTSDNPGVKYFSGTASYTKDVTIPDRGRRPGDRVLLDLGTVKEVAEVFVNGTPVGILWKPPFMADITRALKPGMNHLEIRITNLWPNRFIGDRQPGVTTTYTFSDVKPYTKDSPLLVSGLLGPVRLIRRAIAPGDQSSH